MNDATTTQPRAADNTLQPRPEGLCVGNGKATGGTLPVRAGGAASTADARNAVTLPWPPKGLSPNARTHWRAKAPIAKAYKQACLALTLEAGVVVPDSPKLALWLDFVPPDKRHRDDDNIIAAFKSGRDGVALALGIDDKRFRCYPYVRDDQIGGFVRVRITELPK